MLFAWILCVLIIGARANASRRFRSHPTTVQTFENDTVLLPCHVENQSAQTKVKWWRWRESNVLADSGNPKTRPPERITLYGNGSLQVLPVQREDSGEYVCQATRPHPWGNVTQVYEIEVMYPPSVKTVPASGVLEVNLGDKAEMRCLVEGRPDPVISWRHKDAELPLVDARSRLIFEHAERRHAGRYTCVAANKIGDPVEAHIDLRIRYKPEIAVEKSWVHAHPKIVVQLICTVTAWPEAEVEWYFNNETVNYSASSNARKYRNGNRHTLLLKYPSARDYGSYACRASNPVGVAQRSIEVSGIARRAVFTKKLHRSSVTSYYLTWEVDSYSRIIGYQLWFRKYRRGGNDDWHKLYIPSGSDGVPNDAQVVHVKSYNLTGLDAATHYEAVVLSRNRYGWSFPSEILSFHTDGASTLDSSESLETTDDQNNVGATAVFMSQQHPLAAGAPMCRATALLLSTLVCAYIVNHKTLGSRF